jgi:hypothetical protein
MLYLTLFFELVLRARCLGSRHSDHFGGSGVRLASRGRFPVTVTDKRRNQPGVDSDHRRSGERCNDQDGLGPACCELKLYVLARCIESCSDDHESDSSERALAVHSTLCRALVPFATLSWYWSLSSTSYSEYVMCTHTSEHLGVTSLILFNEQRSECRHSGVVTAKRS